MKAKDLAAQLLENPELEIYIVDDYSGTGAFPINGWHYARKNAFTVGPINSVTNSEDKVIVLF
jgi:hypothetical protein